MNFKRMGLPLVALLGVAGCVTDSSTDQYKPSFGVEMGSSSYAEKSAQTSPLPGQKLIWRANLKMEVSNISNSVEQIVSSVEQAGGYVESKSDYGEGLAKMTVRVPAEQLTAMIVSIESIGNVTYRSLSSKDVTDEYVDVEARLKAMTALRDRLMGLLDKATEVKDILAIEKELGRIQADLDSLQSRLNALASRVNYASIDISISLRRILGPVGYVWDKAGWVIEKLFVIRQ